MRIAFFIQGEKVPSSRFRILQYIPYLERKGVECDLYMPVIPKMGVSHRVFRGFTYHLVRHASQLFIYLPTRFAQAFGANIGSYDAVVIQKTLLNWPNVCWVERYIWSKNKNFIFDVDDAEFVNIASGKLGKSNHYFDQVIKMSKLVIVGNKYLADNVNSKANKLLVLSTTVDEKRYKPRCARGEGHICIGWTGTGSNLRYLFDLIPVFEKLSRRSNVRFKIISDRQYISELAHIENMQFSLWHEDTEVEELQAIDIGLMPLRDDLWTKGKCAFKLIQYMAIGIPSVVSPVGANCEVLVEGKTGYFASTTEEWVDRLQCLIDSETLRATLGVEARIRFESEYSSIANANRLLNAITDVVY